VLGGVLKAWSDFADWYGREPAEAMKKWFDCYNTTYRVFRLLWSRVPDAVGPPFSVLVATVRGEGHVLARDAISLLLASRGLRIYRPRKGVVPEDLAEGLADPSLKYLILSCCQDETRGPLIDLIKRAKAARPDLLVITGGRIAGGLGEDHTLPDPASLLRFIERGLR